MSITPAGVLLSTVVEGPVAAAEKGCCGWMRGDRFLQASQVASTIFSVGSVAAIIMMSLNVAPMSGGTYAFCAVVALLGGQNAWGLQRVKELGGYERQNALYAQQNDLLGRQVTILSGEVDRLAPLAVRFEASAKALEDELGGFRGENARLKGSLDRLTPLAQGFEVSAKALEEELGGLRGENERLKGIVDEARVELTRLQETATTLDEVAKKFRISTDIARTYFDAEKELQAKQAEITHRLEDLAKREEELLAHLSRDVTRLEAIIKEKQKRCNTLAKRVLPLSLQVSRLSNMITFIQANSKELFEAAKADAKRLRIEQFARLRTA
jgi:chromosome segregation ATPase